MWRNSNIWEFSWLNIMKEKGVNYIFSILTRDCVSLTLREGVV